MVKSVVKPAAATTVKTKPQPKAAPEFSKSYKVAVLPGDGTGPEVIREGVKVLNAAAAKFGFKLDYQWYDFGGERYLKTGEVLPKNAVEELRQYDAIYLGAVGRPEVPDHISLWGLLIPIRRALQQYVNLRPVRLLPGIDSPLRCAQAGSIDLCIVRENNEGEYSEVGGRLYR